MKILLINNFHYRKGGSEAVYFNTADILRKAGHEVIFFSTQDSQNIECDQSKFFVRSNKAKNPISGMVSYFYNQEAGTNLEKLIKEEHPDLAHAHLFWGGISPSIFKILNRNKIPLIHTAHDYRMICPSYTFNSNGSVCEDCYGGKFYNCALKRCSKGSFVQSFLMATEMYTRHFCFDPLKNISGFIFVSEFSRQKHIQYNKNFENVQTTVLYNYTKDEHPIFPKNTDEYFLFFGRLSFEKGIKTLIEAISKASNIKLKVVGTGPLESELIELTRNNGNIKFLGYKSGEELKNIVSCAKFIIVPSEWYENNPMTIIEAYSLGVPVIGARIGGIPEIVKVNETGYLFESGNVKDLAKILIEANEIEENLYQRLSLNAYNFYKKNFSEDNYLKKLISFYNKVLKHKN